VNSMSKRLMWTVDRDGQRWGQHFPMFHIYKDGRQWFLVLVRKPHDKPRYFPVKSCQQAKAIANKIAKDEWGN